MNQPPMFQVVGGAIKDMRATFYSFMGIPQDSGVVASSLKEFGRQPADEAWVFTCSTIRARNVAGIPVRVQVKDGKQWVDVAETNDGAGADLQFLLDDVNPAWEGSQLQAYTEAGAAIHGGSYWKKVRGKFGGPPQELHWLSGAEVKPIIPAGASFPEKYEYQPQGVGVAEFSAKDIIAHRDTVNLASPYHLLSPLSAARNQVATGRLAAEWNVSLLNNWGVPAGAWVADKDAEISPSDINLIRRALRAVRGPKNQGKVPILPGGLTWVPLSMSQKDADWIATGKVSRMAICAVLGVPLALAGDDEKSGVYGSVRDAERVMWRLSLIPELDARASRIDSWLVPDFDKTRKHLRVRYDYTGIEALRAAPAEDMAQWNEGVKIGVPLNRYIARFGMGAPVEGGDESKLILRGGEIPTADVGKNPVPLAAPATAGPRPAEYNTQSQKALPEKLYRDPSVKAYIASGEPSVLAALVPDHLIPALAEGIRQRESAEQIAARLQEVTP